MIPNELISKIEADIQSIMSQQETAITIRNQDEYNNASALVRKIKEYASNLDAERKRLKAPHQEEVDKIDSWFMPRIKTLINVSGSNKTIVPAEDKIKLAMTKWNVEQEIIAEEKRRVAEAEAARLRKEAEEKARIQRQKEEELRRQAQQEEDEKKRASLIKKADIAYEKAEEAEALQTMIVAPVITAPRPKGDSIVWKYTGKIIDLSKFVEWCIGSGLVHFIDVKQSDVDRYIASTKGTQNIPGVEISRIPCTRVR